MNDSPTIAFLGGAGTVTGSKFLLSSGRERLLVDCGMFQGQKELRLKNWEPLPIDPVTIGHLVVTHAHIDHSGYLPRLCRDGYAGGIIATPGSCDLLNILLPDAAHLQTEQAEDANRKGFSRHSPALPLFDATDAALALQRLRPLPYRQPLDCGPAFSVELFTAGHILGSAAALITFRSGPAAGRRILFSGDIGRYNAPILPDPDGGIGKVDWVVVESTYGDRLHEPFGDSLSRFAEIVNESVARGGVLLIPAFSVGRTQTLLYLLRQLEREGRIPSLPVFVDSPMSVRASGYYGRHVEEHDRETIEAKRHGDHPLLPERVRFCATRDESRAINRIAGRAVIISASGMLTGGRILHHASLRLPDRRNTFLLCGFQAAGTRGRSLADGAEEVRMHGRQIPVRARVERLDGFSAHADAAEIVRWLAQFSSAPPRQVFIVHGEPAASAALNDRIARELGFTAAVPVLGHEAGLD